MNKKVLVVGGAGYIGGFTCDYLIKLGYDVTVYDKLVYETRYLKEVKFIYGDIRNTEKLLDVSKEFDVIVLMAALVGDPACSVDVELTNSINFQAIKRFCEGIDNGKHIIFMSTCSVYGAQHELLNEESLTNPLSAYAHTKLLSEKYVLEKNGTVFRLGTVYGMGDSYSRIRLDLVVNVLTMKSVYEKKINIFGGEQWRPLLCVKDVSGFVEESIRKSIRGLYVLSEGNYTMKMLGKKMKEIIPDIHVNFTEISFEDARNYMVDNSKSYDVFEYRPQYNIEDEIKNMIKIFEEHRISNVLEDTYNNGQYIKNNLTNIF